MLKEFLQDILLRGNEKTHKTYSAILIPFNDYLEKNSKSLENCTYTDIHTYLKERTTWGTTTKRMLITIVKQLFKWYAGKIPMGTTTHELKHALKERRRIDLIINMKYPPHLREDLTEKRKGLSLDELKKLLTLVARYKDKPAIYILSYFALRKEEMIILQENKDRINFNENKIKLFRVKTRKFQILYFNNYTAKILDQYLEKPVRKSHEFNNRFRKYSKAMGFPIHPNIFRGTFNSNMKRILKDDTMVKILMGYSVNKRDMTARYDDKEAMEKDIELAMIDLHYMRGLRID